MNKQGLNFREDGSFTILQFTDLHYGEDEMLDIRTSQLQEKLINSVNPDLVILTGDSVSGNMWDQKSKSFFRENWRKFTEPMLLTRTHYALALGNHDAEGDMNREQIMQLDSRHPYSMSQQSHDISGSSNYVLTINSKNNSLLNIWVLDSQQKGCGNDENSFGCIKEDQIEWYKQKSNELKNLYGHSFTNDIAFFHIPTQEFMTMWNDNPVYGYKREDVSCPTVNTGFIQAVLQQKDITGVFVGHDHNNDFGGFYQGIELVYGRKTGYGSYGPNTKNGACVIKLKEIKDSRTQQSVIQREHYIIEEDGNIIYPETPQKKNQMYQSTCIQPKTFSLGGISEIQESSKLALILSLVGIAVLIWIIYKKRIAKNNNLQGNLKIVEVKKLVTNPENHYNKQDIPNQDIHIHKNQQELQDEIEDIEALPQVPKKDDTLKLNMYHGTFDI